MACENKDKLSLLVKVSLFLILVGLLLCGTWGIYHFVTRTMPKYYNYNEEKHHIMTNCSNITSEMKGKSGSLIIASGIRQGFPFYVFIDREAGR